MGEAPSFCGLELGLWIKWYRAVIQQDICLDKRALDYFEQARALQPDVLAEEQGEQAVRAMLPGLASETFLQRLEQSDYDLTNRNLRNVGTVEHWQCAFRMILAYYQKKYQGNNRRSTIHWMGSSNKCAVMYLKVVYVSVCYTSLR